MFIFLYTVFRNSSISDEHVFCVALHFTIGQKNKYLILSQKGVDVFNIHKEQQEHIETAIFSVLKNYSDEDLQMVMKLMDDVEKVWQELPW